MKIVLIIILLFIAVSGLAAYILRLNRITSPATDDPKPSMHTSMNEVLTVTVVGDSGYSVEGQRYDLASVTRLLTKDGKPVPAVAVQSTGDKAFGPMVALLDEIRKLGITDIRTASANQPSKQ